MELTAQAFKELDRNWDFRQQVAVKAALGGNRFGLIPGAPFSCNGVFVKNAYEVERFQCLAVLPSGRILSADERVSLTIPMLFGEMYYLTVASGEEEIAYEKDEVPFVRPRKAYAIHSLEELDKEDLLPLVRFKAQDSILSVDADYIPPCLLLDADARFREYAETYIGKLQELSSHANLEDGDGKRMLLRYLFLLKGYRWDGGVREFIQLTQEIAQAVDYFIVSPNSTSPVAIPSASPYDVQLWLQWFRDYLAGAVTILDGVVLEDHSIDYMALLEQAKKELYERLNPELREALLLQIKEELREELQNKLSTTLTSFINDSVKPTLHDSLQSELDPSLHERLYTELYDALYNALFVPEAEEEAFVPMI